MKWCHEEVEKLSPILKQIQLDLEPLEGNSILVLCSAAGEIAFILEEKMKHGRIIGLELDEEMLQTAQKTAKQKHMDSIVGFHKAQKTRIPYPNETFHALVSEFIVFPTTLPTEIGQPEMARVLKPGGKMVLTDAIVTKPVPQDLRTQLQNIGLDYLCEATKDDFRNWMEEAGLTHVEVIDFTPVVKRVWEQRRESAKSPEQRSAYRLLFDDVEFRLGKEIFYIYVRGKKRV
jgi:SAM-dependent methyltransferase